jgi:hypothetical protein
METKESNMEPTLYDYDIYFDEEVMLSYTEIMNIGVTNNGDLTLIGKDGGCAGIHASGTWVAVISKGTTEEVKDAEETKEDTE